MALNELTITLAGSGHLRVETLAAALENAVKMLRSIETEFVASGTEVRWEVVRLSMRSPLRMTLAPKIAAAVGRKIVRAVLEGVKKIERSPTAPEHFNEDSLRAARELLTAAEKDGAELTFGADNKSEVKLTEQAVKHIDEVVARARKYADHGTLEGQLEEISVHSGTSFAIWEALTSRKVECVITADRVDEAKALLGKRVAVTGIVRYRNHKPISIQVDRIRRLREASELPQLEDIPPLNITDGLSSEEYVRRLRDD